MIALCIALGALEHSAALSPAEHALVADAGAAPSKRAVRVVRRAIRRGDDPLGDAFCVLRPAPARRRSGAFYTPPAIVERMIEWTLGRHPARIVDAGCGSGRFSLAARRQGFGGDVVAVDLDPLATLVARANLVLADDRSTQVVQGDFLDLELPSIEGTTAYVGNPPYVRHHDLDSGTKKWGREAGARLGLNVSGLSGLHALFVIAAAEQGREHDLGCLITSSTWLDASYGGALRELLSGPLGCRSLHLLDPEGETFADAMTTAVIVTWRQGSRGPVRVASSKSPDTLALSKGGRAITREALRRARRWSPVFARPRRTARPEVRVPLGTLARVHRGIATGANEFFTMTPEEGEQRGLTPYLRPCIDRAVRVIAARGEIRAGDCPRLLLDLPATLDGDPAFEAYVAKGEREGIDRGYLCRHRNPWWRVGGSAPPPIVATYMARQPPMFALNPERCRILNVLHGLHPVEEMSEEQLAALVNWLNTHREELEGGRTYQGGLVKFEPKDLEALLVPPLELVVRKHGK